jgi:hypothetical protein
LALVANEHPEVVTPDNVCRLVLGKVIGTFGDWLPVEPAAAVAANEPIRARRLPPEPKSGIRRLADIPNIPREELDELALSEEVWDPDPQEPELDAGNCRALLLEIIRRASYDWVLYRDSSKLPQRELAHDAYQWLFVEDQGTPTWRDRLAEDRTFTGFVTICEMLDLDPTQTRATLRKLTIKDVLSVGRPAEHRRMVVDEGAMDDFMPIHAEVDLSTRGRWMTSCRSTQRWTSIQSPTATRCLAARG